MGIWESVAFFARWISAGITGLVGLLFLFLTGFLALPSLFLRATPFTWSDFGFFALNVVLTAAFLAGAWIGMRGRPIFFLRLPWALLLALGAYLNWFYSDNEGVGGAMLIIALPGLALSLIARNGRWLEY